MRNWWAMYWTWVENMEGKTADTGGVEVAHISNEGRGVEGYL